MLLPAACPQVLAADAAAVLLQLQSQLQQRPQQHWLLYSLEPLPTVPLCCTLALVPLKPLCYSCCGLNDHSDEYAGAMHDPHPQTPAVAAAAADSTQDPLFCAQLYPEVAHSVF